MIYESKTRFVVLVANISVSHVSVLPKLTSPEGYGSTSKFIATIETP
jgi:hypothetical protein